MATYTYSNSIYSYGYSITSFGGKNLFEGFFKGEFYSYTYNYNFSKGYNYTKPSSLGDFLVLTPKNDTIRAGDGADTVLAFGGNDLIYGQEGNDLISGGIGNDTLYGDQGNDILWGDEGSDILYGGLGNDALYSGKGNDTLEGGSGNDLLYVEGYGKTTLYGGTGSDTFVFMNEGSGSALGNRDTIKDFTKEDIIHLGFLEGIHDPGDVSIAWNKTENAYIIQDNPTARADDFYIIVKSDHRLSEEDFIF